MKSSRYFMLYLLPVVMVCAAPKPVVQQGPVAPKVTVDLLSYERPDTAISFKPVVAKKSSAVITNDDYIVINVDKVAWEEEQRRTQSLAEDAQNKLGFRIQLYTTTILDDALAMKDSVAQRFNTDIYLFHDAPYYKIRLGDFITHQQADDILTRVKGYGYQEAWIVRSEICHPCRDRREGMTFVVSDSTLSSEEE